MLDQLDPGNTNLRNYLSNNWKLRSEEPVHISPSQCGQARCQPVMVHFVHCCLGPIPTTSPPSQQSVFNQLSVQTSEKLKSRKKKTVKVPHLAAASVNMISRERNLLRSQRRKQGVRASSFSSPGPDYSLGLGQVLVEQKSAFQGTVPYNYGQRSSSEAILPDY